jgi:hypothetical protein
LQVIPGRPDPRDSGPLELVGDDLAMLAGLDVGGLEVQPAGDGAAAGRDLGLPRRPATARGPLLSLWLPNGPWHHAAPT